MSDQKKIPVTVLSGYLGSGKTTLLNYLLSCDHGYRIAVIVNDMSHVNIDAALVKQGGFSRAEEELVQMQNGCICCTLRGDLLKEVDRLSKLDNIDYIVIEASGISEPIPVAMTFVYNDDEQNIDLSQKTRLDTMVTVVDAFRFWDDFGTGDDLVSRQHVLMEEDETEEDIMDLLINQIEFCNVILLNKCDLLSKDQIESVEKLVRTLQPEAKILRSVNGVIDPSSILNTGLFDFDKVYDSAGWVKELSAPEHTPETEEYGITSFVYENIRPFHPQRLYNFLSEGFPTSVVRAKGFVWIPNYNEFMVLLEQAGNNLSIHPTAYWAATMPKDELDAYLEQETELKANWDETYGDRRNQVVFIGMDLHRDAISRQLDECLLTDDEFKQDWANFDDPYQWDMEEDEEEEA